MPEIKATLDPEPYSQFDDMKLAVQAPEDLKDTVKYWFSKNNRLYVLSFLAFEKDTNKQKYRKYLLDLKGSKHDQYGMQLHLSGNVTEQTQVTRFDTAQQYTPDPADYFAFMSFPSENAYGEFLVSGRIMALREKIQFEGMVEEGMVLTREMMLPPKEQQINKIGWEYGNPYELYGEDWFGWSIRA
ncbi:hypothetical protein AOQ84DRAFT_367782 [Glonium stellatum]|uniref:Uncharacterized protein n=1 Tax=Glonium stellatum TaxID=574774 RepID=A0A8E2ESM5_9PEZI|nr:hypothetical protein AOQ84DRAFT_367782 [Glonium stellatum]